MHLSYSSTCFLIMLNVALIYFKIRKGCGCFLEAIYSTAVPLQSYFQKRTSYFMWWKSKIKFPSQK